MRDRLVVVLLVVPLSWTLGGCSSESPTSGAQPTPVIGTAPSNLPASLATPQGQVFAFDALADGVQIYVCSAGATAGSYLWRFQAPEATLYDLSGAFVVGKHYAGPTWEGNTNAEKVVGRAVASVPAPAAGAIPWLLLTAVAHEGHGPMADVSSVQRLDTVGGVAPSSGCDAAHLGEEARVAYQAHVGSPGTELEFAL